MTILEHEFSVELKSKQHVSNMSISDKTYERVLFEGNLGALKGLQLEDGDVLEFTGENGIFRISLTIEQLQDALHRFKRSNQEKKEC